MGGRGGLCPPPPVLTQGCYGGYRPKNKDRTTNAEEIDHRTGILSPLRGHLDTPRHPTHSRRRSTPPRTPLLCLPPRTRTAAHPDTATTTAGGLAPDARLNTLPARKIALRGRNAVLYPSCGRIFSHTEGPCTNAKGGLANIPGQSALKHAKTLGNSRVSARTMGVPWS